MVRANNPQVLAAVDDEGKFAISTEKFNDRFDDGTAIDSISVQRLEDKSWQLIVRGTNSDGNCQMAHTPVDFTPGGQIVLADEDFGGGTRFSGSCAGAPCSACRLLGGGTSCACADVSPSHSCNHTISTLADIVPKFMKAFPDQADM